MNHPLADESAATALISSATPSWIMKHSSTCSISSAALAEVERYSQAHPAEPLGVLVVQSQRPLSNWIAAQLKYSHQSPQLFLVQNGAVKWQASHWSITAEAMAKARAALPA